MANKVPLVDRERSPWVFGGDGLDSPCISTHQAYFAVREPFCCGYPKAGFNGSIGFIVDHPELGVTGSQEYGITWFDFGTGERFGLGQIGRSDDVSSF